MDYDYDYANDDYDDRYYGDEDEDDDIEDEGDGDFPYPSDRDDTRRSSYDYDDDDLIDGVGFADPGGNSSLRAETKDNPRNLPCPTCGRPNRLTPLDRAQGYQCDACANAAERGLEY